MKKNYFLGVSEEGFHRVAYTEWGKANDTATGIICVHGLTRNKHDFDGLAHYLSIRDHHIFCPDIVGRGDSDWLKNPLHYTYEQYISDMTVLIARTQKTDITWIGTSMGGLIGMVLASYAKSPIKRLILNDVGPQIPVKALARLSKYTGLDPDFSSVDDAKNYYKSIYKDFGHLTEEEWLNITLHNIREVAPGKFISKMDHGVKLAPAKSKIAWQSLLHPLKALEGSLFDIDLWAIFRQVTCPLLVIHGSHSDLLLPSTIEKMKNIHPNMQVIDIPDAGHAPLLKDPNHQEMIYKWIREMSK